MTQAETINPVAWPELAAQQVIVEAVKAGAVQSLGNEAQGTHAAKALIALHEQLTAYYRTLPGAQ